MLFNSYIFLLLFLPVCYGVFYLAIKWQLPQQFIIGWLIFSSLIFYAYWDYRFVLLILSSILFNYLIAIQLQTQKNHRKLILFMGICINLATLMYFKYTNLLVETFSELFLTQKLSFNIVLPIAISFFTFEQIGFLVDTYKDPDTQYKFLDYCLFVTFFPRLIAGPIIRHNEVLTQILNPATFKIKTNDLTIGFSLLLLGLFKKIIIADNLSPIADPFFSPGGLEGATTISTWIALFAFSLQIYFDFSSYSDMAIGLSRMFGIILPMNFNSPYKATNISEFWQRWNISLSRFLRDYLYIPLGGNRGTKLQTYRNLYITMMLGGLWHGASWTFLLWGCLHGGYLVIYHFCRDKSGRLLDSIPTFFSQAFTFLLVSLAWLPFRSTSMQQCMDFMHQLFSFSPGIPDKQAGIIVCGLLFISLYSPNTLQFFKSFSPVLEHEKLDAIPGTIISKIPDILWIICLIFITLVILLNLGQGAPFIYFDF